MIFVFGSNLAGRHGRGAALTAVRKHGAIYGVGEGPQGFSYAIPTKGRYLQTLALNSINKSVGKFIRYAEENHDLEFKITRIGCGLANYQDSEIAPFFIKAPDNCFFDNKWNSYLPHKNYWGTV